MSKEYRMNDLDCHSCGSIEYAYAYVYACAHMYWCCDLLIAANSDDEILIDV